MSGNKKYYWLKLNENFFEDDTIQWLEEQENGKDYVIFYLKLCLKSLSDDGKLIRYVGERLIPYDIKALAKLTNTYPDTVAVAMKSFLEIGLIEQLDTGEIYMKQIDEMIGSETDSARRMRKKRLLDNKKQELLDEPSQCDNDVQKCDTEIEIDKEIEIEKENQEHDDVIMNDFKNDDLTLVDFALQNNIRLNTLQIAELVSIRENCFDNDDDVIRLAITKTADQGINNYAYVKGILKNWMQRKLTTIRDIDEADKKHEEAKNYAANRNATKKPSRTEPVPEWVNEEAKKETVVDEDLQKEFEERLKRIREMGAN